MWNPTLKFLDFGSLFSYTPRPSSNDYDLLNKMNNAKGWTKFLKQDRMVEIWTGETVAMSEYVARILKRNLSKLPFLEFFEGDVTLIPVPRSNPIIKDGLWVPHNIALAIHENGIGSRVSTCLIRNVPVNKSGQTNPINRPLPEEHYNSISIISTLTSFEKVLLVDDVITRGSTLLGAANRLAYKYPNIKINAFSAIRTISNPIEFEKWYAPVKGRIQLRDSNDTIRTP